jgi:hypothetical protein
MRRPRWRAGLDLRALAWPHHQGRHLVPLTLSIRAGRDGPDRRLVRVDRRGIVALDAGQADPVVADFLVGEQHSLRLIRVTLQVPIAPRHRAHLSRPSSRQPSRPGLPSPQMLSPRRRDYAKARLTKGSDAGQRRRGGSAGDTSAKYEPPGTSNPWVGHMTPVPPLPPSRWRW